MTIQEFAKMLDGNEYGDESWNEDGRAKELGFVVVFGASDDLCELRGAIDGEVSCFEGSTIHFDGERLLEECECECSYYLLAKEKCKTIEVVWNDHELPCWTYETDIPHATFDVMDEGEKYCRGIVVDIKSLEE